MTIEITTESRILADNRVHNTPALVPYADWLTQDFDENHKVWVATAPVEELIEWAKEQRAQMPEFCCFHCNADISDGAGDIDEGCGFLGIIEGKNPDDDAEPIGLCPACQLIMPTVPSDWTTPVYVLPAADFT